MAEERRKRNRASSGPSNAQPPPFPVRAAITVAEFASLWLKARDNRSRQADAARLRDHVLPLLGARRLRDIRPEDVCSVVRLTLAKKGINSKSAKNAYAVFADLLADALARGLISEDPRVLPPDIWPAEPQAPRPCFTASEVLALTSDERLDAELRIYNSLAFGTGLPVRTICLLRFGDWPAQAGELTAELAATLEGWQQEGFESVFGRAPTTDDWLVPRRSDPTQPHTEGSAYKAFRRCCVTLGIKSRSPSAIRNTFESRADGRRGGLALH